MKSSIDHPFAFFDWYFDSQIYYDEEKFYSGMIEEMSNGLQEIDKVNHIVKVLNADGELDIYSFETSIKSLLTKELRVTKSYIDTNFQNRFSDKTELKGYSTFLKNKTKNLKNTKAQKDFSSLSYFINEVNNYINQFSESNKRKLLIEGSTYFSIKGEVKYSNLEKLYDIADTLEIFDYEKVTETDFIDVLSYSRINPVKPIQFNVINPIAVHFLVSIQPIFNEFTFSKIAKSKLFVSMQGSVFSQGSLDTAKSNLNKRSDPILLDITKEIDQLLSKIK